MAIPDILRPENILFAAGSPDIISYGCVSTGPFLRAKVPVRRPGQFASAMRCGELPFIMEDDETGFAANLAYVTAILSGCVQNDNNGKPALRIPGFYDGKCQCHPLWGYLPTGNFGALLFEKPGHGRHLLITPYSQEQLMLLKDGRTTHHEPWRGGHPWISRAVHAPQCD